MSFFSFYLSCFFFYKAREQEDETGSARGGRGSNWHQWQEVVGKAVGR
jgi:hypothetical protein